MLGISTKFSKQQANCVWSVHNFIKYSMYFILGVQVSCVLEGYLVFSKTHTLFLSFLLHISLHTASLFQFIPSLSYLYYSHSLSLVSPLPFSFFLNVDFSLSSLSSPSLTFLTSKYLFLSISFSHSLSLSLLLVYLSFLSST